MKINYLIKRTYMNKNDDLNIFIFLFFMVLYIRLEDERTKLERNIITKDYSISV